MGRMRSGSKVFGGGLWKSTVEFDSWGSSAFIFVSGSTLQFQIQLKSDFASVETSWRIIQ
jgi:hypothetical protein